MEGRSGAPVQLTRQAREGTRPSRQRPHEKTVSVCLVWAFGSGNCFPMSRLRSVLEEAGIDMASLVDPRTRLPTSLTKRLLELQIEETGDPAFGLRVGAQCPPGAYGMVEQLARSAPTLRDSIRCYERYGMLVQETAETKLVEQGHDALIVYRANEPQPRAVADFVLSYTTAMLSRHVRGGVAVAEAWLSGPPPDYRDVYAEVLDVPARFHAPCDALVIPRDDLAKPMCEAREPVHAALEAKARRALDRLLQHGSFEARVRSCIRDQLARGRVGLEPTAERLHVSSATLRRRLAGEGTTFRQVLDAIRIEVARRDLLSSRLAPSEIATRIGFSHPNGFYKAFKRWTGLSPAEYRARHGAL